MSTATATESVNSLNGILTSLYTAADSIDFTSQGLGLLGALLVVLVWFTGITQLLKNAGLNEVIAELFQVIFVGGFAYWVIRDPFLIDSIHQGFLSISVAALNIGTTSGPVSVSADASLSQVQDGFTKGVGALASAAISLWDSPVSNGSFKWWNFTTWGSAGEAFAVMIYKFVTAMMLLGITLLFCAAFVASQVMFIIGVKMAPLMIPFFVLRPTSFIADGWFKFLISAGMQMIVGALILGMTMGLVTKVGDLSKGITGELGTQFGLFSVLFLLVGIMGYLMSQALSIGAGLARGMSSVRQAMPPSMAPNAMAGRAGSAVEKGVGTGLRAGGAAAGAVSGTLQAISGVQRANAATRSAKLGVPMPGTAPLSKFSNMVNGPTLPRSATASATQGASATQAFKPVTDQKTQPSYVTPPHLKATGAGEGAQTPAQAAAQASAPQTAGQGIERPTAAEMGQQSAQAGAATNAQYKESSLTSTPKGTYTTPAHLAAQRKMSMKDAMTVVGKGATAGFKAGASRHNPFGAAVAGYKAAKEATADHLPGVATAPSKLAAKMQESSAFQVAQAAVQGGKAAMATANPAAGVMIGWKTGGAGQGPASSAPKGPVTGTSQAKKAAAGGKAPVTPVAAQSPAKQAVKQQASARSAPSGSAPVSSPAPKAAGQAQQQQRVSTPSPQRPSAPPRQPAPKQSAPATIQQQKADPRSRPSVPSSRKPDEPGE